MNRCRVGLLSDTHGWLDPRVAGVLADCDLILHAGDVGNAGVLAQLAVRGAGVIAVRGNNDLPSRWPDTDQACLHGLGEQHQVALPGGDLWLCHGHQCRDAGRRHAWLRAHHPAVRAIVYGHSHQLVCDLADRPWMLNPGAAGRARTHGGPGCLLLDASATDWIVTVWRFAEGRVQRGRRSAALSLP